MVGLLASLAINLWLGIGTILYYPREPVDMSKFGLQCEALVNVSTPQCVKDRMQAISAANKAAEEALANNITLPTPYTPPYVIMTFYSHFHPKIT